MRINPSKELYLPAASIIAVVLLLLVVIGVSTYRNLDRQKEAALAFVHRQAVTILRSIEASARTGMMMHGWADDAVEMLIQETALEDSIDYIYLFDGSGTVTHHSDTMHRGKPADWIPELDDEQAAVSRLVKGPGGRTVFEMAKRYTPLNRTMRMRQKVPAGMGFGPIGHSHAGDTLVLGMDMTAYETAHQADLQHAVIMAGILLVLGTGTLFFLFVTQNYYLVSKTLDETRNYSQLVVRSMANGLLSIDPAGRIVSYNRQALDMMGIETSGAKDVNLSKIVDFESTGIRAALQEGRSVLDREIFLTKPSGQIFPVGMSVSPIVGEEDRPTGAVLILRDLTEIKQLEEKVKRSEKMAAVGRLAAGVAHEIRNPLSSIRGFVHFLKRALYGRPREIEYADIIVQEIDRINRVISDLLVFSKPAEAEFKPVEVPELIAHAVKLISSDADSRRIKITSEITACENPVMLDFSQMTQVLLNLLLNAVQAVGEEGSVGIGARCSAPPEMVHLWVEDDGPGIPGEHKGKIFDPFFTSRQEGTGLGLAIVSKIVENHNGEIRIASPRPGLANGCRVDIDIPLLPVRGFTGSGSPPDSNAVRHDG